MAQQSSWHAAALERGWWMALAMGGLSVVLAVLHPAAIVLAVCFFAAAWGIRRRRFWAAVAATAMPAAGLIQSLRAWGVLPTVLVLIAAAFFLAVIFGMCGCAMALWRDPGAIRWSAGWVAFLLLLAVYATSMRPYILRSGSMENTLLTGDCVLTENLTWSLGRTPRRGDVIQVRLPSDPTQILVKRVVGVPGDRLRLVNKQLFRDGQPVEEPYAIHTTSYVDSYRDNFPSTPRPPLGRFASDMLENHVRAGEVIVPPGCYFALGDNRDNSLDSRYFGFIPRAAIVGSPVLIYESFDGGQTVAHMRWNRVLRPV